MYQDLREKQDEEPSFSTENDKYIRLKNNESEFENAMLMFCNCEAPNYIYYGQLGNEKQNAFFADYHITKGYYGVLQAYIRCTLLKLVWNIRLFHCYMRPENAELVQKMQWSNDLIVQFEIAIHDLSNLSFISRQLKEKKYYFVSTQNKVDLDLKAKRSAWMHQLEFTSFEKWTFDHSVILLDFLFENNCNPKNEIPREIIGKIDKLFFHKMDVDFIERRIRDWGFKVSLL